MQLSQLSILALDHNLSVPSFLYILSAWISVLYVLGLSQYTHNTSVAFQLVVYCLSAYPLVLSGVGVPV